MSYLGAIFLTETVGDVRRLNSDSSVVSDALKPSKCPPCSVVECSTCDLQAAGLNLTRSAEVFMGIFKTL